ncbi:MAG: thioredoxin family protein [Candidatus Dojkabacteria bacterium]|nr:thioredoxin family protein [Candidatus Dojkabacteria bacterium]
MRKSKSPSEKNDRNTVPSKTRSDSVMEISFPDGISSFATPLAILLSAIVISGAILYSGSRASLNNDSDGSTAGVADTQETVEQEELPTAADLVGPVVRQYETFTEYDSEICKADGKPVVYLFSTTWCPHCEWIKDTFDSWAKENSDKVVAYHWELDTNDNTLTEEAETEVPSDHRAVYDNFNPNGSIPTFVFGCRYGRVGNGFETEDSLDMEREAFDKIVEELI